MEQLFSSLLHHVVPFIVVISVVVFVHEFGHYIVARMCGVKIDEFSLGFGQELFGWNDKHGTRWKVSWLPLGGYVKMFGDSGPASVPDEKVVEMSPTEKKGAFYYKSVEQRMAIVLAGPLTNYLFAIIVLALFFIFQGQPYSPANISNVVENGPAAKAGFMIGDHIIAVDGSKVDRFEDVRRLVALNSGTPVTIDVERKGSILSIPVTPEVVSVTDHFGGEHKTGRIGIVADKIEYKKWSPIMAVWQAGAETIDLSTSALKAIGQIIIGARSTDDLGGPLRIAKMASDVAKDGSLALVWLMAMISVNLGLINLFPIPLLDGGHLAFYLIERVCGRPLHKKVQDAGFRIGLVFILCLMVFATWNDLVQLKFIPYLRSLFS